MPEIKMPVNVVKVHYRCDSDTVLPTNMVLASMPPQYPHVCRQCHKEYVFMEQYPKIRHEEIK